MHFLLLSITDLEKYARHLAAQVMKVAGYLA